MRKYEYETGRFTSIDPLWNKYYGWTPYQYSMNSPLGLVDFDGMDVVEIMEGNNTVESYEEDENEDIIYMVDKKGNRIPKNSLTMPSGTIESFTEETIIVAGKEVKQSRFEVNGDDNAQNVFEFLSDPSNTNVEWGWGELGGKSSNKSLIGTNHMTDRNPFGGWLFSFQYETVDSYTHNHPSGLPNFSDTDSKSINNLLNYSPNTNFRIFVWPSIYVDY